MSFFSTELSRQSVFDHVSFDLYAILGGVDRQGLAVRVYVVAILAIFDKSERIVLFDLLHRSARGRMVVFKCGFGECTDTDEFLISVVHFALREGDGRARYKEDDAVFVGDDLQIRGVNYLDRI